MYKIYNKDNSFEIVERLSDLRGYGLTDKEIKKVFYSKVTKIGNITIINYK